MLYFGAVVHPLESHNEHQTVHSWFCGISNRPTQANEQTMKSFQTFLGCFPTDKLWVFNAPQCHNEGNLVKCDIVSDRVLDVLDSTVSEFATLDRDFTKLLFESSSALYESSMLICSPRTQRNAVTSQVSVGRD